MAPQLSITAAPQPTITDAPQLQPRSTYDLNSELSWLYSYLGSSYSYNPNDYSSLMDYYSSLLASYTIPTTYPTYVPTATAGGRTTNGPATTRTGTAAAVTETGTSGSGSSGGLSTGAKIGIGVGVPLAVFLLAGLGIFLWCMGKRKGKQTSTTVVAPAQPPAFPQQQQQQQQQPPMGYTNNQGYMQGYPQPTMSPPPQYPHPQQPGMYGGYAKGPGPDVVELEHEYHFARPGVVEMGDSGPVPQQEGNK